MNQMNQVQDDEINLFELFQTLWYGKWPIIAFSALSILFGSGFLIIKNPIYQSKVIYFTNVLPPYYKLKNNGKETKKPSADFKEMFYSVNLFDDWKKVSGNTSITFNDFSATKVVNGFILSNKENKRMATLVTNKINKESFILIRSNELPILDSFFQYAQHINKMIKSKYKLEALNAISNLKNTRSSNNAEGNLERLNIELFIYQMTNGEQVFTIKRPSEPEIISPKKNLVLIISILFGGITGVFFVFIRKSIRNRK